MTFRLSRGSQCVVEPAITVHIKRHKVPRDLAKRSFTLPG
jgi:hypothetical protein